MIEDVRHNNPQCNSSLLKGEAQEPMSTKNSDLLIDPYDTGEKGTRHCDDVIDMIVTVKASSSDERNSYMTSKNWPKAPLLLSRSQHKKIDKVLKPTRI